MNTLNSLIAVAIVAVPLVGCIGAEPMTEDDMVYEEPEEEATPELADQQALGSTECFEQDNPRWDMMRSMVDQFVQEGKLSREKAATYKCDPRQVSKDMPVTIVVEEAPESSVHALTSGCATTGTITVKIGSPTPLMYFRQSLDWCYDGNVVSDWSGQCTGWVTTWGWANFWNFDGCTTNDFIKYWLNGHYPGGIHHRTIGHFTNDLPYVPHYDKLVSTWGHYDGTADFKVY
jgi:hypothetical protein